MFEKHGINADLKSFDGGGGALDSLLTEAGDIDCTASCRPNASWLGVLNLSRGKLREALKVLEEEGRIWRHVGVGTFVGGRPQSTGSNLDSLGAATTLSELLEIRTLIEPVVAGLAALRGEAVEIEMIERYSASAAQAQSWSEWEKWDDLLHRAIVEASGNGLLINIMDQLLRIKAHPRWTMTRAVAFDSSLTARYVAEHRAVVSCIKQRDCEGARAAMLQHIRGVSLTVGPMISQATG